MALTVPLIAVPSQTVNTGLNNQACTINVYQMRSGLFCDLYVGATLIIAGVVCQNLNRIVRNRYLGFSGDLVFVDGQGKSDPEYAGLGGRYSLVYLFPDELPNPDE